MGAGLGLLTRHDQEVRGMGLGSRGPGKGRGWRLWRTTRANKRRKGSRNTGGYNRSARARRRNPRRG